MKQVKKKNFNIARIKVIGVGGGGGNAVSRMASRDRIRGVEFVAVNTDAQDLEYATARKKLYIGKTATKGLGTGMNPELGKLAAEENKNDIAEVIKGSDAVFITAGLGGGTGSGAAPIVAEIAKEAGVLTIAVVTKPFSFEGSQRMRIAQEALGNLKDKVDTLIVIPNDRIFNIIDKNTSLIKAFEFVDDVLRNAVQAVSDLVVSPGLINVDFADIKAVMKEAGAAVVGIGQASGSDRALKAVSQAISSPLLEVSMEGAKGVLFSVSGGKDLRMSEISDIAKVIVENMDPGARVIFGAYHDRRVKANQLKVTLIATGFNGLGPARIFGQQNSSLLFNLPSLNDKDEKEKDKTAEERKPIKELILEDVPPAAPAKEDKPEDKWDIPAFLRRKKNK